MQNIPLKIFKSVNFLSITKQLIALKFKTLKNININIEIEKKMLFMYRLSPLRH